MPITPHGKPQRDKRYKLNRLEWKLWTGAEKPIERIWVIYVQAHLPRAQTMRGSLCDTSTAISHGLKKKKSERWRWSEVDNVAVDIICHFICQKSHLRWWGYCKNDCKSISVYSELSFQHTGYPCKNQILLGKQNLILLNQELWERFGIDRDIILVWVSSKLVWHFYFKVW